MEDKLEFQLRSIDAFTQHRTGIKAAYCLFKLASDWSSQDNLTYKYHVKYVHGIMMDNIVVPIKPQKNPEVRISRGGYDQKNIKKIS